ncbi:tyrosine-protein kinase Fer [Eurytemora carolleeae]|uniref:tyrosine-protein kinase Fer n=1 Tax=Eurytemora carolleeae TaxID=1294199 RepID=UPI000C768D1E|nr:tyrosine-protein kinase Fer [Eurytemora carolleeae]|eukprot:XP_023325012.1 tyrosine-protein kinase Fer-like [Eurytemora affinis]
MEKIRSRDSMVRKVRESYYIQKFNSVRSQDGYRAGVQRNQPFLELTEDITFEPLPTVLNNNTARADDLERISLVYSREALRYNGTIGQGWFGWIVEGSLQGGLKVIVKMLRDDANQGEVERFKMEHKIWNSVRHPNLAGAVMGSFDSFPLLSILEYTHFKSAKTYLREHPNKLDSSLQLQLCMDATAGLDALFNKGIAHPDLANTNCLT